MGKYEPFVFVMECCLPYPALPLTFDNVFEVVKTVRLSWRRLAKVLLGWDDAFSDHRKKLDAIERQHVCDEACLKAVLEAFLLGEGDYHPSWKRLIHQLHRAEQSHVSEKINTNAEPQQGERISVWGGR